MLNMLNTINIYSNQLNINFLLFVIFQFTPNSKTHTHAQIHTHTLFQEKWLIFFFYWFDCRVNRKKKTKSSFILEIYFIADVSAWQLLSVIANCILMFFSFVVGWCLHCCCKSNNKICLMPNTACNIYGYRGISIEQEILSKWRWWILMWKM